jgi:Bacterial extracellular solute-binding proteins, family 3
LLAVLPAEAQTLGTVKTRGILNCGANKGVAGFAIRDARGNWSGFNVDFCRALAAAIFDDPKKVKFAPLTTKDRFTALQSGEVDLLVGTTWTISHDTALGFNFTGIDYYDEQDEPLGPLVRHGDDQWFDIVKWVHFAMLNAEEAGVTSKSIDKALKSENPDIKKLVGIEGNYGEQLGLTKDWVVRIVRHVGNYGERFERNVGEGSPLKIERGLNALWTKGGLQYAPPIR